MPLFGSSKNSWSSQASGSGGFFHPEKKCPPVDDCDVKTFLGTRRAQPKTSKQLRAEKKQQDQQKKDQKKQKKSGGWPFAGSYDPNKDKGSKGKSRGR